MTVDKKTKNHEDFIRLKNKYFIKVLILIKRNLFFLPKKKRAILKKFSRIPNQFLADFNQESYLHANADVKEGIEKGHFANALEHFIFHGYQEVRNGKRRLGNEFPFISETEYIKDNQDVKHAVKKEMFLSPFDHLLTYGYTEMLNKTRKMAGCFPFNLSEEQLKALEIQFDSERYLSANNDVKRDIKKGVFNSAWEHFTMIGIEEVEKGNRTLYEGLKPFDASEYIHEHDDVFQSMTNGDTGSPYEHYLFYGANEMINGTRKISNRRIYNYIEPTMTNKISREIETFKNKPLISVLIPVYNVDKKWLELAIRSVQNQWYTNWEICIADDASTKKETIEFLESIDDTKIKVVFLKQNVNISGASNAALKLASGEYIALMDHDDELTPDALYEVVKTINDTDAEFIYSDEDKLDLDEKYRDPHFKADFAPDMFLSQNYLSHLSVIKKSLIDAVDGWTIGLEGAQDYDLYLKVLELTDKIVHIPKVLYHWRMIPGSTAAEFNDKSYAQEAGFKALENVIKRRKIAGKIVNGKYPGTFRLKYDIIGEPLVSIVIPFKDKPELLDMCINSILDKSTYQNYEIIGISNNSEKDETFKMMNTLGTKDKRVSFYEYNVPFNFSKINNYAVKEYAKGDHILLLNNDIEIISPDWIEALLEFSQRTDIGVVGAKLYYPNDTIQHAGVILGIGGVAGHSHKYFDGSEAGYFSRLNIVQNLSAVTAACFMVKRTIFDDMKGLNANDLKIAFNDVEFCLRVREQGYLNVFTPYCETYHHESISRGTEDNPEKIARFNNEVEYMLIRHKDILKMGDPYYNINLTLHSEDFKLK